MKEEGLTMKPITAWFLVALWIAGTIPFPATAGSQDLSEHTAFGTITHVDHQTGLFHLNTGASELLLHFPPQAIVDG
jgi:hypothetical protein